MKTKLIALLCMLMTVSFCIAQITNTNTEIKLQQSIEAEEGCPKPSSLMEEPRAFLDQSKLSVSMPESREAVVSIMRQMNGTMVYQRAYFHTQSVTVDLSGMPTGTYQLRIEIDGTVYTGTFRL